MWTILVCMMALDRSSGMMGERNLIISGEHVSSSEFPYTVSIMSLVESEPTRHVCSGSLINRSTVLTSAHCIHDVTVDEMVVIVGADNYLSAAKEQMYRIASFAQPGFEYRAFAVKNDIALLFLASCVPESIIFPVLAASEDDDSSCSHATTVGFGKSEQVPADLFIPDGQLRTLTGPQTFHSHAICKDAFISFVLSTRFGPAAVSTQTHELIASSIDSTLGCYGGDAVDRARGFPCEGDSGGPVLSLDSRKLVGVTSFSSQNCGTLPNYYTRVSKYGAWIKTQVSKNSNNCSAGVKQGPARNLAGTQIESGLETTLHQLNATVVAHCPLALHFVETVVASPTSAAAIVREACSTFVGCIDEHSSTPSIEIVNSILTAVPSSVRDSEVVPSELRRLVTRLLLCNSEFEMYYRDIEIESGATFDFMSRDPAKDECKLITS